MMQHSCYGRLVDAANHLPADLNTIFNAHYRKGLSISEICKTQNISVEDFLQRKTSMLRALRSAATFTPKSQEGNA